MRVGVVTLGCDKNTVDSERYLAELVAHGAEVVTALESAEIIVVNTCGFIDAAKKESIDEIVGASRFKSQGTCRAVIAVGCMVQRHKAELEAALPEVDLFLGAGEAERLVPELIERGLLESEVHEHPGSRVFVGDLPHVRYLKISEGCDHGCAFCAIPLMRGKHRSFALDEIVREAQLLELQGAREINLVAQDLAHYGRDRRDGIALPRVLQTLVAETGIPWIRMLYLYSAGITPALLECLSREARIVKYLDMPMQHGSDAVLARMRRPERAATIRRTVERVREAVPDIAIRTTCIVGFPGETDDDYQRLLDLLEDVQFDRVGAFTYSAQEGTRAAELADDVPEAVKHERLERLTELQRGITGERYSRYIGTTVPAIVDRVTDDGLETRLQCQADDIDGTTLVTGSAPPGTIISVDVDDVVDDYDFRATLRGELHALPPKAARVHHRALPVATTIGSWGR
jgi:ribosomal protein S12 methylthiotransferase